MKRFGDKVKLATLREDRYHAEDIAQELFCKVYEKLDSFRVTVPNIPVYRITVNKCATLASSLFKRLLG